jgi:hypothetical protein
VKNWPANSGSERTLHPPPCESGIFDPAPEMERPRLPAVQSHRENRLTSGRPAKSSHHTDCRQPSERTETVSFRQTEAESNFPCALMGIETAVGQIPTVRRPVHHRRRRNLCSLSQKRLFGARPAGRLAREADLALRFHSMSDVHPIGSPYVPPKERWPFLSHFRQFWAFQSLNMCDYHKCYPHNRRH